MEMGQVAGALPASFVFNPADAFGPNPQNQAPVYMNTDQGVPPNNGLQSSLSQPGGGGGGDPVGASLAYGAAKAGQPPSRGPLLWLFGMVVVGVLILGTVAHLEVRD